MPNGLDYGIAAAAVTAGLAFYLWTVRKALRHRKPSPADIVKECAEQRESPGYINHPQMGPHREAWSRKGRR